MTHFASVPTIQRAYCSRCGTLLAGPDDPGAEYIAGQYDPEFDEPPRRRLTIGPVVRVRTAERDGVPAFGLRRGAQLHGGDPVRHAPGAAPDSELAKRWAESEKRAEGEGQEDYFQVSLPDVLDTWCQCGERVRIDWRKVRP